MEKAKKDIPYFKNGCRAIRTPYFVTIEPIEKIPKFNDFCEPQRGLTRSKSQFWKYYGIRKSHVKLPICPQLEARSWLKKSESQKPKPKVRRMSVAGAGLYVVDNAVRETGSDFLTRINRTATVTSTDNSTANVDSTAIVSVTAPTPAAAGNVVSSANVSVPAPVAADNVVIDASLAGPSGLASISRFATVDGPPSNTDSVGNTQLTIRNNFNPFQRLANAPFRPRAQSVSERARRQDPPDEEPIDFSKDMNPYPAERSYRMRRSSSFVSLLVSKQTPVIIESPNEQMIEPKVEVITEPDETIDQPITEPNEPIDQSITDKTMNHADDMEVDEPNVSNDPAITDGPLNEAKCLEVAEPNEPNEPNELFEPNNQVNIDEQLDEANGMDVAEPNDSNELIEPNDQVEISGPLEEENGMEVAEPNEPDELFEPNNQVNIDEQLDEANGMDVAEPNDLNELIESNDQIKIEPLNEANNVKVAEPNEPNEPNELFEPNDLVEISGPLDEENGMEVAEPNEPNELIEPNNQVNIDEQLDEVNGMELADETTNPAITDEPLNENDRAMRAVAKWIARIW